MPSDRQLVIGLGTGRCGTTTLSVLLEAQSDSRFIHEGAIDGERHLVPWGNDEAAVTWLRALEARTAPARWFGDVGMYFLPSVEVILSEWPTARFIVLRRARAETVTSFLKKTEGRNHWADHDGEGWMVDDKWDPCFPSYSPRPKEEALKAYWDEYYHEAEMLTDRYPDSIRIWNIEVLNSVAGRKDILQFAGYSESQVVVEDGYHANAENDPYHRHGETPIHPGAASLLWRRLKGNRH